MTKTPSARPPPEPEEATVVDFGQSRAEADPEDDGQHTLVWEGAAQLAELEAQLAQGDTRVLVDPSELMEQLPPAGEHSPQPFVDPRVWFLGRSFGGFRVVCELASGGMATVFLARKEGPARVSKHAAIKVVHPHLIAERDFIHMFLDEARIAACLDHPNVCRVLDFGQAEGTYYLAMEYLLGETWSSVRAALSLHPDGRQLLPSIAAHVLAQACEGLHAAHEASDDQGTLLQVVHRDVSPQNIFVAYDGTVRVLDFGVASAADRITSTRDGILKGRLAYMSPEQMAGEPVGRAADIWAMGVVLREALEGKRLFRRVGDAETMFAVTSEPLPPWSVEVPERLRAIAERALSRSPAARYASAHEMALELTRFASAQRGAVGISALSTWMQELFALQIEQKRALLQLPVPEPHAGAAPSSTILVSNADPVSAAPDAAPDARDAALETNMPAERRRRVRWPKPHALLALGCLGAFTGVVLGRVLRSPPERPAPRSSPAQPVVASVPRPIVTPTSPTLAEAEGERTPAQAVRPDARARAAAVPTEAEVEDELAADPAGRRSGALLVAFEGGWAEVYLGTKLLGTTPGRFELPAGRHTLLIKPFGGEEAFKRRVDVQAAAVTKLFLSAPQE
jgi:serine/threonine protein kinase